MGASGTFRACCGAIMNREQQSAATLGMRSARATMNHFRKHPKTKKTKPTFSFGRGDLEENLRGVCVTQIRAALLTLDGPCFFCRTPSRPYAFIGVRASFPEIIGQNSKRKSSCAWITRVFFSATLAKVSKAIRCKVGEALHGCATDLVLQLRTYSVTTNRPQIVALHTGQMPTRSWHEVHETK
jgi:hypothetical protein